ncbi:hypothetical protein OBP_134 [Pseudomonas phage OBP]|uniref:hypothetical protein n=1 Tax=Pseudomonas phage OBP TaxID=1124849 RepID=UPI000240D55B|nr:hypothetical protein OBP_134 [Pseudomonas phage OBP]AEV89571.1 hypothetical protein OBP_134 [Pseudomonas phage OBP]
MERLKKQYSDSERLDVLVNREDELLLLLDSRHAKFEKQNLSFIDQHHVKTNLKTLRPSDVVRLVRHLDVELYSTDIGSINQVPGGYQISIRPDCLIHYGTFKIKYREYNEDS